MRRRHDQPVTIERLERALTYVAQVMVEEGPAVTPIFERLEREIAALRARDDAMARARRYLDAHAAVASDASSAIV